MILLFAQITLLLLILRHELWYILEFLQVLYLLEYFHAMEMLEVLLEIIVLYIVEVGQVL